MISLKQATESHDARVLKEFQAAEMLVDGSIEPLPDGSGGYVGLPITVELPGTSDVALDKLVTAYTGLGWSVSFSTATQTTPPSITLSQKTTTTPKKRRGRKPRATAS